MTQSSVQLYHDALNFAVNSLVAEFTDSAPLIHLTQWNTMVSEFHAHSILTYLFLSIQLNVISSYSVSLQGHLKNGLIRDFVLGPLCI